MSKNKRKNEKRKFSKKKFIIFLLIICIILFVVKLFNTNITNIYISGNNYYSDQEIIDLSGISNYPKSIKKLSFSIEKKLEKDIFISKAHVTKNLLLNKVYIEVEENYPLFYYLEKNNTILKDGKIVEEYLNVPTVNNILPDEIYDELIDKFKKIDIDILNRMSELNYEPNERYDDRFLILMNDGNYIYITLDKFLTLNKYLSIIKYIDSNENGIIKLDSGKYFDEFDE